jgi:predicted lipoprotein with Yx(FWY)xxD motif
MVHPPGEFFRSLNAGSENEPRGPPHRLSSMRSQFVLSLAAASLAAAALTGCAGASTGGYSYPTTPSPSAAASSNDLATASTFLGTVVVDGKGMTAYFFDVDKANSGKSACVGACAAAWPAITTTAATPVVKGVTGTVGTIATAAGGKQITINGRPIYTFASDNAAGDVNGQGVKNVWHVIAPDGSEVMTK